jgi:uncharacterized membrane protein YcaP (DUF421 family)
MEIVFRAAFLYLFIWFLTRLLGQRSLAQLTAFELVVLVVMGDLIQQGVTQEDSSVTGAVLALGTFAALTMLLAYVSWRIPRLRPVLSGAPRVVVRDGRVCDEVLHFEQIPVDELLEAARLHGVRDLADVDLAVLEANGTYAFFQRRGTG